MRDLEGLVGYHMRRASQLLMAALAEQLAEVGLRVTDATVLVVLDGAPLSSQSEIGRTLSIKRANMTPLIAGLTARGLVKRASATGRAHPLQLTRKGQDLAARARECMAEHDRTYFANLSAAERQQFIAFLSSLWRDNPDAVPADEASD